MTHGQAHMPVEGYLQGMGLYVASIIILFLLGRITHELTHVLVANAFGLEVERIEIHLFSGHVEYRVTSTTPWWQPRAVNAAPQLIGIVVGLPALAVVIVTQDPLVTFLGLVLWIAYAGLGSASDLSLTAAVGDGHLWHATKAEQLVVIALGLLIAVYAIGSVNANAPFIGTYRSHIQLGFVLAALGVFGMGILEYKNERPA